MKNSRLVTCLIMLGLSTGVHAQEYMFTYSKLYSPLKHNLKEDHDDVKIGLFFTDFATNQPCAIKKAWMEKEEHYEELVISDNGEVNVPLDSNLKNANPLVYIHTDEQLRCDYSLVVLTKKPLQGQVGYQALKDKTEQMTTLLGQLGGMFSSWFTPSVNGVTLEFKPNTVSQLSLSDGSMISIDSQGKGILKLSDLSDGVTVSIPVPTQRVMPYIVK